MRVRGGSRREREGEREQEQEVTFKAAAHHPRFSTGAAFSEPSGIGRSSTNVVRYSAAYLQPRGFKGVGSQQTGEAKGQQQQTVPRVCLDARRATRQILMEPNPLPKRRSSY